MIDKKNRQQQNQQKNKQRFGNVLRTTFAASLLTVFFFMPQQVEANAAVNANTNTVTPQRWHTDFHTAQKEAKRLNRPLLVHFHAPWCMPCKEMDREVLQTTHFYRQVAQRFVLVKIDIQKHPKAAAQFGITSVPADQFLEPSGGILLRTMKRKSLPQYSTNIQDAYTIFKARQAFAANDRMRKQRTANKKTNIAKTVRSPQQRQQQKQQQAKRLGIGLNGYSPVALRHHRKLIFGNQRYSTNYKGITYHFANAQEKQFFLNKPEKYAPQLLGFDPVLLDTKKQIVRGDVDYGAFYDGKLFFFANENSRREFHKNPLRYVNSEYVLRVSPVDGTTQK